MQPSFHSTHKYSHWPCWPSAEMSIHWISCSYRLYLSGYFSRLGVAAAWKMLDGHFALTTWEHCFLSVMSTIWQSPASASSASKPIYSQLIHFIAIRWWQHFEVFAEGWWGVGVGVGGRGSLIGCFSWFAPFLLSWCPPVTVSWIRRPTFLVQFCYPPSWFSANSLPHGTHIVFGFCEGSRKKWFGCLIWVKKNHLQAQVHISPCLHWHGCVHMEVKYSNFIPMHMTLIDSPLWVMMCSVSHRVAHNGRPRRRCDVCSVWNAYMPLYTQHNILLDQHRWSFHVENKRELWRSSCESIPEPCSFFFSVHLCFFLTAAFSLVNLSHSCHSLFTPLPSDTDTEVFASVPTDHRTASFLSLLDSWSIYAAIKNTV